MRLNRFLAACGLGSRRACEKLILERRVRINNRFCTELATNVDPDQDRIEVNGHPVKPQSQVYLMLNKPEGYVTSAEDELGRPTVFDLLPAEIRNAQRLFYVGRLDRDSEGLMLLTNDGDLAQQLTHPSHHVAKEYEVCLNKPFDPQLREKLSKGVHIPIEKPVSAQSNTPTTQEGKVLHYKKAKGEVDCSVNPPKRKVYVTLCQGLKRQVRLMFYAVGYEVEKLRRIRLGSLKLGQLRPGECRFLTPAEVTMLKKPRTRKALD